MARYKAVWRYSQCCNCKGQIFRQVEGDSLREFAGNLCTAYAYTLGDSFSFCRWENEKAIRDSFGDDLPAWFAPALKYPVLEFISNFGTEILQAPTAAAIIKQIANENYGDYNLTITGI